MGVIAPLRSEVLPSAFSVLNSPARLEELRAGRVTRAESADAQAPHGECARLFDVARPIDEVAFPEPVRRLVGTHAAEGRTHTDRKGLERARIVERRVRHAVMQE